MKKKIVALCLMAVLTFSVTACGGSDSTKADNNDSNDVNVNADVDVDTDVDADVDADVDTEVAESEGTLVFDAPEGFTYDETAGLYTSPNANEMANINYYSIQNDGSFYLVTESMMEEALESSLSAAYGETLDIDVTKWESIVVDGYDAISYEITYDYSGFSIIQAQVIVNGTDQLHYLTFTSEASEGYADEFAACINSMRFE